MIIMWKKLLWCLAIPLGVGGASALLTSGNTQMFEEINKPPLSPPGWLFPVVWTILYLSMGVALYLVVMAKDTKSNLPAYISFGVQLFFNFFWSIIFFNARAYLFAFIWLVLLWVEIIVNIFFFLESNLFLLQMEFLILLFDLVFLDLRCLFLLWFHYHTIFLL